MNECGHCATRFGSADSSARGRAGALYPSDRRKLHWQPVSRLQKDRAGHALEEASHDTTGTRIGGAESCGTKNPRANRGSCEMSLLPAQFFFVRFVLQSSILFFSDGNLLSRIHNELYGNNLWHGTHTKNISENSRQFAFIRGSNLFRFIHHKNLRESA